MSGDAGQAGEVARLRRMVEDQAFAIEGLGRQLDELLLSQRLAGVAEVEAVRFSGPPKRHQPNPTAQGAGNPLTIAAYVFIPHGLDQARKHPLIVLPHGGVHSRFGAGAANVVAELTGRGYTVIAPDYRGSTGYGRAFYEAIDYGGREVDDTAAARRFALEAYPFLDPARVAIAGWSHGGLIALFSIFDESEAYAAAYASVPVSDLVARMGYKSQGYRDLFSAPYHIGKTAEEDVAEYRRRSPSWQTARYAGTPLLIHTNTSDEDVNVLEVERLIGALKGEGKPFEYKIYQDAPGGHIFNRLDTALARESRAEAWRFLAQYL
jgi:dipeptidyl aminopeptidase/acylaminoacyl peptidase